MGLCPPQAGVAPALWAGAVKRPAFPLLVFPPAEKPGPKAPAPAPLRGGKAAGSRLKPVTTDVGWVLCTHQIWANSYRTVRAEHAPYSLEAASSQ